MASDLDRIVDYYLREQHRLEQAIEEHLRYLDYSAADLDHRALCGVKNELERLLRLKNPLYPKMKRLQIFIESFQRRIDDIKSGSNPDPREVGFADHYLKEIQRLKAQLRDLEANPPQSKITKYHWKETLEFLWEKRPVSFAILHFNDDQKSRIEIQFTDETTMQVIFHKMAGLQRQLKNRITGQQFIENIEVVFIETDEDPIITFAHLSKSSLAALNQLLSVLIIESNRYFPSNTKAKLEIGER